MLPLLLRIKSIAGISYIDMYTFHVLAVMLFIKKLAKHINSCTIVLAKYD